MTRAKDISKIVTDANLSGTLDVTGTVTAGGLNSSVSRTSGANATAITLSDNVTGAQTSGFGTRIVGASNSNGAVSAIGFEADGGTNNDTAISLYTQPQAGTLRQRFKASRDGDISFYEDTGTTPKLFWQASTERLGIGTVSPSSDLHIVGSSGLRINNSDDTTNLALLNFDNNESPALSLYSNDTTTVRIHSEGNSFFNGGNVGIGTSSPSDNLHIQSSSVWSGLKIVNNISGGAGSTVTLNSTSGLNRSAFIRMDSRTGEDGLKLETDASNLVLLTASTERMRITSAGNVGIGTSSPDTNLDVEGAGDCTISITAGSTSHDSKIDFVHGSTIDGGITYDHNGTYTSEQMVFRAGNNTPHMYLTGGGDLLVGKTSVNENIVGLQIHNSGQTLSITRSGGEIMSLNRQGSDGTVIRFSNDGATVGTISVSGSSTAYNTSSDHRLKENVTADWDATTRLKQLNPVRFNFISNADTTVDGFLAHEVQSVVPEAITGTHNEVDADGNPVYQGIDQSKLVPLLVKTIQELEARITALENGE